MPVYFWHILVYRGIFLLVKMLFSFGIFWYILVYFREVLVFLVELFIILLAVPCAPCYASSLI
jgi:hypothetical protein